MLVGNSVLPAFCYQHSAGAEETTGGARRGEKEDTRNRAWNTVAGKTFEVGTVVSNQTQCTERAQH